MKKFEVNPLILTGITLCAFAANSFLGRAALGSAQIDPLTYTLVRLLSGAVALVVLLRMQGLGRISGSWAGALALLTYAVFFSLAYVHLATGTGALVLFGLVQLTMMGYAAMKGDVLKGLRLWGALLAVVGLLVLLWPKLQTPDSLLAALSMALSGAAWGAYSLLGRGSKSPLADTAGNFCRAGVLMLSVWAVLYFLAGRGVHIPGVTALQGSVFQKVVWPMPTWGGLLLAVASGALASGMGYALWYRVLPALPATSAATVQLAVPVLATLAGTLMLGEALGVRLLVSMVLTLGGIYWVLNPQKKPASQSVD